MRVDPDKKFTFDIVTLIHGTLIMLSRVTKLKYSAILVIQNQNNMLLIL